jgi:recombination protein RecR
MQILPPALTDLIEALGSLPGVGPRTAERYAYYLLKHDQHVSGRLSDALQALHGGVGQCKKTFALVAAGQELSDLYTDPRRDKQTVAVVAEPFDVVALEKTGQFHGTYHVLGGLVSPIDGIGPEQLHIAELVRRVEEDGVKEIILATNASVEGETTALYIQQQLAAAGQDAKVTRLARGLPIGVDLEYADQITLGRALEGRQTL